MKYAFYENGWHLEIVDDEESEKYGSSLTIDDNGISHICYSTQAINYAENTSGEWEISLIDDASGGLVDIAADSDSKPYLLYMNLSGLMFGSIVSNHWEFDKLLDYTQLYLFRTPRLLLDRNNLAHIVFSNNRVINHISNIDGQWTYEFFDFLPSGNIEGDTIIDSSDNIHTVYGDGYNVWYQVFN